MPCFKWRGLSPQGAAVAGVVYAYSPEHAVSKIMPGTTILLVKRSFSLSRLRRRARATAFAQHLAELLKTKLLLGDALRILAQSESEPILRTIAGDIAHGLQGGIPLNVLVALWPEIADPDFISFIENGERSGDLVRSLISATGLFECRESLKGTLLRSLAVPLAALGVALCVMGIFIKGILPQYQMLIETTARGGHQMPSLMRAGIFLNSKEGLLMLIGVVAMSIVSAVMLFKARGSSVISSVISWIRSSIPALRLYDEALFLAQFQVLIDRNISLAAALHAASARTGSVYLKKFGEESCRSIEEGIALSTVLEKAGGREMSISCQ